jgi:thioredoxin:protein disulfide reductase
MKSILAKVVVGVLLFAGAVQCTDRVVSIRAIPSAEIPGAGKSTILTIELVIAKPFHINSNRPLQEFLIPTTLEIEPQPGVTFGKVEFPPAPSRMLPVSDSPMSVFEGSVRITVPVTPAAGQYLKEILLKGKVRYQACNDNSCLPPVVESFNMILPAVASAAAINSSPSASVRPTRNDDISGSMNFDNKGLLLTFFLVFAGGLALNLTPCVYPLIPITISYFGGQAQGKKGSLILHAFLYMIGMAVTYSILGVIAALTGGLFGAVYQYPPVLAGISIVMVLLALSMFDVYELRLPGFLNRLAAGSQKGFLGTLLMGLTVGIVAAPCIGPFIIGLLTYVGNKGSVLLGLGLFFVLSLGMGTPFVFLAVFSGSIHRLPRSGAWMVWVRKIFGFILLAMAAYFLKPLMPGPLAYYFTLALILLLAGIYVAWIDTVQSSGKVFPVVRNIAGVIFFAAALYAVMTGIETGMENPRKSTAGEDAGKGVQWLPYSQDVLTMASRENKPVFIDFYADWCAPCKELDKSTFSAPEVVDRSKDFFMLKVDLTTAGDAQTKILRDKYQVLGVPTLVFLNPAGQEMKNLRGTGFESSEIMFDKMAHALKLSSGN